MAIVFISPKERQKVFILGIAAFFLLVLGIISLRVFLAKPKRPPVEQVFRAPKITINFDILNSDKLKKLEFLPEIEKEFNYTAQTAKGESKSGKIAAANQEKATQILTGLGLLNITLEEVKGGRKAPFTPYYEIKKPPTKKTKK